METKIKKVELISWHEMHVYIRSDKKIASFHFELLKDGQYPLSIYLNSIKEIKDGYLLKYRIDDFFDLGHDYLLVSKEYNPAHLDVSRAVDFENFDEVFTYTGNDLGATYFYNRTDFALWAPLANDVYLKYFEDGKRKLVKMRRCDKGVYRYSLDGDRDGTLYSYIVYINGMNYEVVDPYAKSSNANCKLGAVINLEKLYVDSFDDRLPYFKNYVDAIIYELHVRDFTIHPSTNIENKGKYKGLCETGRTSKGGHPAGIDYISSLGVTHVQLQPIQKVATIDELNPDKTYNWGYDPYHYFVLEGSYSSNPNDPYARVLEFKKLVREFHKKGIRVNLDVVYNHMYETKNNSLNKITPYYFFRHDANYNFIDHTYCGNDFASERPMVRKLIVDSIVFLLKTYGVDGFRFDLMGLLDIDTMNEIAKVTKSIKRDIMLYGEGWDMMDKTSDGKKMANMYNAELLPDYAFFNDRYRNIARGLGGGAILNEKGYLLGNEGFLSGFKFVYLGSCIKETYPPLFLSANQSLNYIECHDNATLYDCINNSTDDNEEEIYRRLKTLNKTLLYSYGIPFIHAGQEIGLTKKGHHNTYNKGDSYNQFNYDVLDDRYELYESFKNYIKQRRDIPYLRLTDPKDIDRVTTYEEKDNALIVTLSSPEYKNSYVIVINPTNKTIYQDFHMDVEHFIKRDDESALVEISKNAMIFPISTKTFKY